MPEIQRLGAPQEHDPMCPLSRDGAPGEPCCCDLIATIERRTAYALLQETTAMDADDDGKMEKQSVVALLHARSQAAPA